MFYGGISLLAAGAGVLGYYYFGKKAAQDKYLTATSSSAAASAYEEIDTYDKYLPIGIGVFGLGGFLFGASFVIR